MMLLALNVISLIGSCYLIFGGIFTSLARPSGLFCLQFYIGYDVFIIIREEKSHERRNDSNFHSVESFAKVLIAKIKSIGVFSWQLKLQIKR